MALTGINHGSVKIEEIGSEKEAGKEKILMSGISATDAPSLEQKNREHRAKAKNKARAAMARQQKRKKR